MRGGRRRNVMIRVPIQLVNTIFFEAVCLSTSDTRNLTIMESKGKREEMNRTTTKLPGFTAEASLFTSNDSFSSEAGYEHHAIGKMVIPAQLREAPDVEQCNCPCCMERTDVNGNKHLVCC
jgi:hypothetical protein